MLDELFSQYAEAPQPIEVSFRQLFGPIPVDDLTHSIYPYPARLLRQIPRFFVHCDQIIRSGDSVLDPFCGSGTVLVEAQAAGVDAWGVDANPFARLLSRVKTTLLERRIVEDARVEVLRRAKQLRRPLVPDVVNIDLWFSPAIINGLGRLRRAIVDGDFSPAVRDFLLVALAATAERCSFRDQRIPVPVRRRDWRDMWKGAEGPTLWEEFEEVSTRIGNRVSTLPEPASRVVVAGSDVNDARKLFESRLEGDIARPGLILTSPPYGAAQKYVRSSSLALGWTGLAEARELPELEAKQIGREHLRKKDVRLIDAPSAVRDEILDLCSRNPARGAIYAHYFREMDAAIEELACLLRPGGFLILVAGSNVVAGRSIKTHGLLRDFALDRGLKQRLEVRDRIRGRVLLTKRASQDPPIVTETVHVLQKT